MRIQGAYNVFSSKFNTKKVSQINTKSTKALPESISAYKTNQSLSINSYKEVKPIKDTNNKIDERVRLDQESERISKYLRREKRVSFAYKEFGMGTFVNLVA